MLNFVRRGPASATTLLLATPICSHCARAVRLRGSQQIKPTSRIRYPLIARSIGTSPQWRRSAAAGAAYREDPVEGEVAQENYDEKPLSNGQTDQTARQGPVTKFIDLAEQGLVCRTVVDTLIRDMGLETMTQVQSLTLNESLKGTDV